MPDAAPAGGFALALALALAGMLGCGYRSLYAGASGEGAVSLHVKVVHALVPDAVTSDEVAAGASDELARAGLLAGGDGFPRVEIEVLRADETSEGIAAVAHTSAPRTPGARATAVAVVARACVVRGAGEAPEHDTGDLRAEDVIAVDEVVGTPASPDPRASAFHETDAMRAAARRLGRRLARRVLGLPAASDDEIERP